MRKLFWFYLFLFPTTMLGQAQLSWRLFNAEGYAASVIDTSKTFTIKANSDASLFFTFNDSADVGIVVDYTTASGVYASYTAVDSTGFVVNGGTGVGYILRRGGTDNIAGGTQVRVRVIGRVVGNGVTSATFSAYLLWRDD